MSANELSKFLFLLVIVACCGFCRSSEREVEQDTSVSESVAEPEPEEEEGTLIPRVGRSVEEEIPENVPELAPEEEKIDSGLIVNPRIGRSVEPPNFPRSDRAAGLVQYPRVGRGKQFGFQPDYDVPFSDRRIHKMYPDEWDLEDAYPDA